MNTQQIEDQLKEIKELVYKNKETTERLEGNWNLDREDFAEFKNRLGHLEEEFKSLRQIIQKLPQQTQNRVLEIAQPIVDESIKLRQEIKNKTIVRVQQTFWEFIKKIFRK